MLIFLFFLLSSPLLLIPFFPLLFFITFHTSSLFFLALGSTPCLSLFSFLFSFFPFYSRRVLIHSLWRHITSRQVLLCHSISQPHLFLVFLFTPEIHIVFISCFLSHLYRFFLLFSIYFSSISSRRLVLVPPTRPCVPENFDSEPFVPGALPQSTRITRSTARIRKERRVLLCRGNRIL